MKRNNLKPILFLILTFCSFVAFAQDVPAPSTEKIIADIKADGVLKTLESYGVPSNFLSQITFEKPNTLDQKNFSPAPNYYFHHANTFKDRVSIILMAVIPKAAFGVSYRIPVTATYQRFEPDGSGWKILSNWKYESTLVEIQWMMHPKDMVTASDEQKQQLMESYLANHPLPESFRPYAKNAISIVQTGVFNKNKEYGIEDAYAFGKYYWRLVVKTVMIEDKSEGMITQTRESNDVLVFMVDYSKGNYSIKELYTYEAGISEDVAVKTKIANDFETKSLETPIKVGNWFDNGWTEVYKKTAEFKIAPCTEDDLRNQMTQLFKEILAFNYTDKSEINKVSASFAEGASLETVYSGCQKRIFENFKNGNPTATFVSFTNNDPSYDFVFREANPDNEAFIHPTGTTELFVTYVVTFEVPISKKQKETRTTNEYIKYEINWKCINGKMIVQSVNK